MIFDCLVRNVVVVVWGAILVFAAIVADWLQRTV
jgi:hypothetical protein